MNKEELLQLTYEYVTAFHYRNIDKLDELLDEDISLKDPSVNIQGREEVVDFISDLYDKAELLTFYASKILAVPEDNFSLIEFDLIIKDKDGNTQQFRGTDHITWTTRGRIERLEAFLY